MVSKALVVGAYQRKLEEIAAIDDVDLLVAVPPSWREGKNELRLDRVYTKGYRLEETPIRFNGHYHVHFYPRLPALIDEFMPDIVHMDEEPFNLATWLGVRRAGSRAIPTAFYTWQNIYQNFPVPFRWIERDVLARAALAIAGNHAAAQIMRSKGFKRALHVIPQFGIDPDLFSPRPDVQAVAEFTIGFVCGAGRLLPRKGLGVLLDAVAHLRGDWRLEVYGTGPALDEYVQQTRALGIEQRVEFRGTVSSTAMGQIMQRFDVLAGPSLTTRRWKEQFGRMLVEAMACEVAVVGSDSGEIPEVIGDAGLVVPESNSEALCEALQRLHDDGGYRRRLASAGRARALAHFTQRAIAQQTVAAYREALSAGSPPVPRILRL